MQTMLERALEIAREAHAGQVDKAGRPVIEHVLRVVDAVEGEDAKVVAALHDVFEGVDARPISDLRKMGFPGSTSVAIARLTRQFGEMYFQYIDQLRRHRLARRVKVADVRDHLHPDRIGVLTPSHAERYRRALVQLGATPDPETPLAPR